MAVVGLSLAMISSSCGSGQSPNAAPAAAPAATTPATTAEARFLQRYVTTDGRVIRLDQGGDIVSEGQAYGMLIAEAAGRPATVRAIWTWTRQHLAAL